MKYLIIVMSFLFVLRSHAQKKPLDHTVYDSWQSIGEKQISSNGNVVAYTVNVQEGDAEMVVQNTNGSLIFQIPRGYSLKFTEDSRFLVFKIKPLYKQTRDAKIKKKKPDEMPKDSLGIIDLTTSHLEKIARVRSYKIAEKSSQWLAYNMEKPLAEVEAQRKELDSLGRIKSIANIIDSLTRETDSLRKKLLSIQTAGLSSLTAKPLSAVKPEEVVEEGTDLFVRDLSTGTTHTYKFTSDYLFSKYGNSLVVKMVKKGEPSKIIQEDLSNGTTHVLMTKFNDAKGFALDETGRQVAFVAERDSVKKESTKFYKLYYYANGDSAILLADKTTKGIPSNWGISEYSVVNFSKSGKRLFFGTAPILPPKDTTLPEFERVSVDIWNYKDDNLMPYQLKFNDTILRQNYLALYDFSKKEVVQLGNEKLVKVEKTLDGDGDVFYGASDYGKRIERQWQGYTLEDWYAINPLNGENHMIVHDWKGRAYPSYTGKYLLLYNELKKQYVCYDGGSRKLTTVAADIKFPLYDETNDEPTEPASHGILKWMADDKHVVIYDRYDAWRVDPLGKEISKVITGGRTEKIVYRYENVQTEEKYITEGQPLYFTTFNEIDKWNGIAILKNAGGSVYLSLKEAAHIGSFIKARDNNTLLYVKESFVNSPNVYVLKVDNIKTPIAYKLSNTNPQQNDYSWGTAELFKWKAYTGKETEGILYKPENFDASKKYPMIVYFYDRTNTTLFNYQPPAPTPSRLNIPFFVSRGYIVFVPDIWYTTGHPGKSAYDYIVSGTRSLVKKGFVDSTKIGIQGQSWGGYQAAYVITQTHLFKAAWAGAPVVNMFSAYGGVRWETGVTRQMQYEKGQSRIGATLWEKPQLYIVNSPLFHLQSVTTPLVIMSNDADGAVPWYQGIEFFTAMRRLHKPVWLLDYNGEAHNLVERKNRKDIQIREQQFFDWQLKGAPAPKWISEGVPAIMKGRDLGLGTK